MLLYTCSIMWRFTKIRLSKAAWNRLITQLCCDNLFFFVWLKMLIYSFKKTYLNKLIGIIYRITNIFRTYIKLTILHSVSKNTAYTVPDLTSNSENQERIFGRCCLTTIHSSCLYLFDR